jgi:anti-anti-sigma factor
MPLTNLKTSAFVEPSGPAVPTLHVSAVEDRTVARVEGCHSLDHSNADSVCRLLLTLAEGREGVRLQLDLAEVESVSNAALGSIVLVSRWLRASGGRLGVANARPLVRELFSATKLDCVMEVLPAAA